MITYFQNFEVIVDRFKLQTILAQLDPFNFFQNYLIIHVADVGSFCYSHPFAWKFLEILHCALWLSEGVFSLIDVLIVSQEQNLEHLFGVIVLVISEAFEFIFQFFLLFRVCMFWCILVNFHILRKRYLVSKMIYELYIFKNSFRKHLFFLDFLFFHI